MASIRDFRDVEGKAIQPYFAAYMIEHGFGTPEEAARKTSRYGTSHHEYLIWNQQRWAQFERETGKPHHGPRASYATEFTEWLQARCDELKDQRCATCRDWRPGKGECWSPDRLDGDMSCGPAGITDAINCCEAWTAA